MNISAVSNMDTKMPDVSVSKPQVQASNQTTQQVQTQNTQKAQHNKMKSSESNTNTSEQDSGQTSGNGYNKFVDNAMPELNKKLNMVNKEVSYELHDKTNRFVIQVKDSDTGDVLKEVPSKETLDFVANILEFAGVLVDEKG
ncbi:MAG: flagellar protein FlaG [bacterium]